MKNFHREAKLGRLPRKFTLIKDVHPAYSHSISAAIIGANLVLLYKCSGLIFLVEAHALRYLLHNLKKTEKPENAKILATGVKNELYNKFHDASVSTTKISLEYLYSKFHGANVSTKKISPEHLYSKKHDIYASIKDISPERLSGKVVNLWYLYINKRRLT